MKRALSIVFMVLLAGTFLAGCVISQNSHTSNSSFDFSKKKVRLDRVEPGVTTKAWVIENFGHPERVEHPSQGEEILRYENRRHTSSNFSMFLIFGSHNSETTTESISFRIKDGVVQSYWTD